MPRRSSFLRCLGAFGIMSADGVGLARADPARYVVYLCSYSHVDPDWLWPYQEGEQQAHSTFLSVLGILDAYPELRFSMTGAAHYRWVRESDPALFERIKAAVRRGQWEPLGGWWVEADTNIPSGETLMRQAEYGQREFERSFGVRSTIAFPPDSFGSSANLPTILRAQGMTGYVMKRGTLADGSVPPPNHFLWHGIGAAAIPTYKLPLWNGSNDVPAKLAELAKMKLADAPLVVFGLGDHGGGPSRAALQSLERYRASPGAVEVRMTRVDDFFARSAPLKVELSGELEGDLAGSYANANGFKRALHRAERALNDVERYDAMWYLASGTTDAPPDLDEHWETVLARCHHDTVSGTAAQQSMIAAQAELDAVSTECDRLATRVLEKIVARIPHTLPDEYVVAAFNPLEREVEVPVTHVVGAGAFSNDSDQTLRDVPNAAFGPTGSRLPLQIAQAEDGLFSGALFPVVTRVRLPPLGYATIRLRKVAGVTLARSAPAFTRELRNDRITVTFDEHTGQPASIRDRDGIEYLRAPSRLVIFTDQGDTWGRYGLPVRAEDEAGAAAVESMRVMENGSVRAVLRVWLKFGTSRVRQDWELLPGEATVRCALRTVWNENQTRLAFWAAPAFSYRNAAYDVPFGRVSRALSETLQPATSWVSAGASHSLALIGAGAKAYWAAATSIGINLLRAGPYISMSENPASYTPDQLQDVGEQRAAFAIRVGSYDPAALCLEAERIDRTFPAMWVGVQTGGDAARRSFMTLDATLALASLRREREHPGTLAVRTYDISGKRHRVVDVAGDRRVETTVEPFGVIMRRIVAFRD